MLEKKLLTLGCALAILACGACFLPPVHEYPPQPRPAPPLPIPPPPAPTLKVDLGATRSIRIVAQNASPSHRLDPARLSQWMAWAINNGTAHTGVTAHSTPAPIPGEAVLTVTILNENAADSRPPDAPRHQLWPVELDLSATLTRADGVVLQQIKNASFTRSFDFPVSDPAVWNQWSGLQHWIAFDVSNHLVYDVLYR